jgi:prephenate dehydrogenase
MPSTRLGSSRELTGKVVGILGVGLIGGSIGSRARRNGARVIGTDCNPAALDTAHAAGVLDAAVAPQELFACSDIVVIATHLDATLGELRRLSGEPASRPALVIDVASVKSPVVKAATDVRNFVATHPMAGSERSGVAAARADLFEDAPWAYVPARNDALDTRARDFIASCGGVPIAMDADEHDRIVALTSHAPQAFASCYAAALRETDSRATQFCGPVARELLRIAGMNSAMWRDIFAANARNVTPQLRRLAADLNAAADALDYELASKR